VKPPVWVLAGLEPLHRAGLLVDVEMVRGLGLPVRALATSLTCQGGRAFSQVATPVRLLEAQWQVLRQRELPGAVKVGLVVNRRQLERLVLWAKESTCPWVVDPLMHASSGERLSLVSRKALRRLCLPNVVLTPNLVELQSLVGAKQPLRASQVPKAEEVLLEAGARAVVVKGGHASGKEVVDWVVEKGKSTPLKNSRLRRGSHQRGTGCRFASALAAHLAQGHSLKQSALAAQRAVRRFLVQT
jgi:hydroxymethylpyrimidine/phosphomethylpyrimidine kinase